MQLPLQCMANLRQRPCSAPSREGTCFFLEQNGVRVKDVGKLSVTEQHPWTGCLRLLMLSASVGWFVLAGHSTLNLDPGIGCALGFLRSDLHIDTSVAPPLAVGSKAATKRKHR